MMRVFRVRDLQIIKWRFRYFISENLGFQEFLGESLFDFKALIGSRSTFTFVDHCSDKTQTIIIIIIITLIWRVIHKF